MSHRRGAFVKRRARSRTVGGPSVLLITESTYPYTVGGVSTWCDQLLRNLPEIDWTVQPIVAGGLRQQAVYPLPDGVRLATPIDLWGTRRPPMRLGVSAAPRPDLAASLARAILGWQADPLLLMTELAWCHLHPAAVVPSFRHRLAWQPFVEVLDAILAEPTDDVTSGLEVDTAAAVRCFQAMAWVACAAAFPIPETDVVHVTAAGWAVIPGLVQKMLHGTPMLLTEHGIYVREAYLAAARSVDGPGARLVSTRIARGFTRAAYYAADIVSPVTDAHRPWEEALGVNPDRIRTIPNGVQVWPAPPPAQGRKIIVSVGRIDPLKDILTMLRVAAAVTRRHPDAAFLHYGPIAPGQEAYFAQCERLHRWLYLQGSFRFMGPTTDPKGVVQAGDIALMTSISEGFPMAALEALAQGRPVVTTLVGGVLDAVKGAGITAAARDVDGLADAICTLLENPQLAALLGARGRERVQRHFTLEAMSSSYRQLFGQLAGAGFERVSA